MTGTNWFLVLAVVFPIVLILVLELLQRLSNRNHGFITVGERGSTVLATYIPAAVAICVASMYSSVEAMMAIFAPFAALKRGNASAKTAISLNLVGKLAPHALLLSFKGRHYGVSVILVANFIAAFLTITVSGLYSVIDVADVARMTIQQADSFNFDLGDLSTSDNQAGAIARLVETANLPYPKVRNSLVVVAIPAIHLFSTH